MRVCASVLVVWLACAGCGPGSDRICLNGPCPEQSQSCKDYINCYVKTGGTRATLDSSYGPMGTCWTTSRGAVDACSSACSSAVLSLRASYPDAGC